MRDVDYEMQVGQVSDDEVMSFADRVVGRARKTITQEGNNIMGESKRRELEEVVRYSGYRIEALCVFEDPSSEFVTTTTTLQVEGSPLYGC